MAQDGCDLHLTSALEVQISSELAGQAAQFKAQSKNLATKLFTGEKVGNSTDS